MDWKLTGDRPIWLQLKEQITQRIILGEYPMGSRLPTVRELATEAGVNPNTMQRALAELETENVRLTAQYEQIFDMASVKEAAEQAGMGKPSSSQITYIDLSDGDSAVVYQKEDPSVLDKLLASLNHGIYAVVEYFD